MRWDDVHLDRGTWEIPETKGGEPHTAALSSEAVSVLAARKARVTGPWVFPGPGKSGHYMEPKRAWRSFLERTGIDDLRIHDLRRTLAARRA